MATGGEALGPLPRAELAPELASLSRRLGGGRCVVEPAALALLGPGPWEGASPDAAPHAFADVALGVAAGALGVAENGAVAVPAELAPHRALLFLCERLVLLLDATRLVPDMHDAFRALPASPGARTHLSWIAGPSKTSDIEQTLVIGAHGPRALFVLGYAPEPEAP